MKLFLGIPFGGKLTFYHYMYEDELTCQNQRKSRTLEPYWTHNSQLHGSLWIEAIFFKIQLAHGYIVPWVKDHDPNFKLRPPCDPGDTMDFDKKYTGYENERGKYTFKGCCGQLRGSNFDNWRYRRRHPHDVPVHGSGSKIRVNVAECAK